MPWLLPAVSPLLAALLLLRAVRADSGDGVSVNQIDLLGGTVSAVALLAAFFQVLPSPVQLCHERLERFLAWLREGIEADFCVTLSACADERHTQAHEPTLESMRRRILTSIGEDDMAGCVGPELPKAADLVQIIQDGHSAQTLLELAAVARYPHMRQLRSTVRVVYCSPTNGRSVIVLQWLGMLFFLVLRLLAVDGVPPAWRRMWRVAGNVARRCCGSRRLPRGPGAAARMAAVDYSMADLARHRTVVQHEAWVRFGLYYMLVSLAGRQLSVRSWGVDETRAGIEGAGVQQQAGCLYSNNQHVPFRHVQLSERRLAAHMAAHDCATARLLYSTALHSLRTMLLCGSVTFVPAYLLASSFRAVRPKAGGCSLVVASHSSLNSVYRVLFDDFDTKRPLGTHAAYDLLLKRLQSRLGDLVTSATDISALLSATMLPGPSAADDGLSIDGVAIPAELAAKLQAGRRAATLRLKTIAETMRTPDALYWGPRLWLVYMLRAALDKFCEPDRAAACDIEPGDGTILSLRAELKLLCFSPFQPRFGVEGAPSPPVGPMVRRYEVLAALGYWEAIWSDGFYNSVPAWCTCVGHCRGICTLLVGELNMDILMTAYFATPYAFRLCVGSAKSALRLICITSWASWADAIAVVPLAEYRQSQVPAAVPGVRTVSASLSPGPTPEYPLSDLLYGSETVLAVVYGGEVHVHVPKSDVAFYRAAKDLLKGERIVIRAVVGMEAKSMDEFSEQVGKEISLSDSRLRYMMARAARNKRMLNGPFRSHGPRATGAMASE
ncbi:hypothetical protein H4R26_003096 [Coemansia thaxteri]|uniref:Uncharacterized protein n=1 Tax=Coemansia thaxteri TaxID=2663907 RepID=A0A9W8BDB0_9FUNG|nr:hypothetical protein H4R26_003096 [Coemansia thaxteri]KAJ2483606.1 hypothetical protein EV174_002897 [Coemansia sp. RSA 2320]